MYGEVRSDALGDNGGDDNNDGGSAACSDAEPVVRSSCADDVLAVSLHDPRDAFSVWLETAQTAAATAFRLYIDANVPADRVTAEMEELEKVAEPLAREWDGATDVCRQLSSLLAESDDAVTSKY